MTDKEVDQQRESRPLPELSPEMVKEIAQKLCETTEQLFVASHANLLERIEHLLEGAEPALEHMTIKHLSQAIDEILASRARSETTAGEIARLKDETRSVLAQIEANLKQHVA